MTADWKGIYDGITSFAGLKDQALGAGKESFVGAFKNYVGLPDLREVMGQFNFNPVPSGLGSIPGAKIADETSFDFGFTYERFGPRNGNWGGKDWSGGRVPALHGGVDGSAPPLDSADELYMLHDLCYNSNNSNSKCDAELVRGLKGLPEDSRKWRRPPRPGTESDSESFRKGAIQYF